MKSIFKKIIVTVITWEARLVLMKYKPDIIAVTGSVGKTSTKDAIYTLLSDSVFVRKSDKSFNSEIGLPLTILGCQNGWNDPITWFGNITHGLSLIMYRNRYPKCLVLELGADHPGDIHSAVKWLRPDVSVITAVSKVPVHVEFFSSPKAVLEEKLYLARGVKKATKKNKKAGRVVLPANDPDILAVMKEPALAGIQSFTFGVNTTADVTANSVSIVYDAKHYPVGMSFTINYAGNSVPVTIMGVVGLQHIYSIVAASAAALAYGISIDAIVKAIPSHRAPKGRMNVLHGINGSVLIDDCYNASPDAVKEALAVLCDIHDPKATAYPRKIAVLGDMMELGSFSSEEHKKIGIMAARALTSIESPVQGVLVTVGIRARDIALGAESAGMSKENIQSFDTSAEAADYVKGLVANRPEGNGCDVVLVKGSQSARLERVTRAVLAGKNGKPADDAYAKEVLVRQEPEWLAKA